MLKWMRERGLGVGGAEGVCETRDVWRVMGSCECPSLWTATSISPPPPPPPPLPSPSTYTSPPTPPPPIVPPPPLP